MALDWRNMDNELTLSDIIEESLAVADPEQDNQIVAEIDDELDVEDDGDASILDMIGDIEEDDEDVDLVESDEEVDDDGEDDDPSLNETYEVKVDGEVVEVSLKEALAGYQRQADYTRKAQALAAEKQEFEQIIAQYGDTVQTMAALDDAWSDNPITVLTHFLSNTENPTHSMALLIKEAASNNMLEQEFLDMFGITPEIRKSWNEESEVNSLRRKVSQSEKAEMSRRQEQQYEMEVQRAMMAYSAEVDNIVQAEGLKLSPAQRDAFQVRLAQYAYENELTNLTAAYKALKYEETVKKREVAKRTKERAKQKKAASVVGRSSSSGAGQQVADNSDLESVIKAAMKEQGIA